MALRLILLLLLILTGGVTLTTCTDPGAADEPEVVRVRVTDDDGTVHAFKLEPAIDNETRVLGLGQRTEIADDGGMAFFFVKPAKQNFVMRDCPIPIDIVYVDHNGVVDSFHAMVPEDPQRTNESDAAYNRRLRRYPSRFNVPIVLEFAGGTIERLGIGVGETIEIEDLKSWRSRAK